MGEFLSAILTGVGLVLVLEGLFYAIGPATMKTAMRIVLEMPDGRLRYGGLIAMVVGCVLIWLVRG